MSYQYILLEEQHGIATLTLNRPDVLNALSADMAAEMIDAIERLADARAARVLVITVAGRAFSSGAALAPTSSDGSGGTGANAVHETHYNRLLTRLVEFTCAVIASVNGPAERAEQWGLIYKAVDGAELNATTQALAARLATGPTRAYGMIRQGIRYGLEHSLMDTVALERRNQLLASRSRDFSEGAAAFRDKRKARFQGE